MIRWIKGLFAKKAVIEPTKPTLVPTKDAGKFVQDKSVAKPVLSTSHSSTPIQPSGIDLTNPLDPLNPLGIVSPISPISPLNPINSAPIESAPECRPTEYSSPACSDYSSSHHSSHSHSSSYDGGGGGGGFD